MSMRFALEIKKRLRALVWPLIFACVAVYFGIHLVKNDYGLLALQAYDAKLAEAEASLATLVAERVKLERETAWLRPGLTHPDSLGEQARARLSMGAPDEVLILGR